MVMSDKTGVQLRDGGSCTVIGYGAGGAEVSGSTIRSLV